LNKSSAVAEMGDRGHKRHGPKTGREGAAVPLSREELGPRLTQCGLAPRPTNVPSAILIHPAVWPQYT